uniref:Uncharacterized protein LOC108041173 n=1 Tax=Drosophila rhopaloa TaxID=1041015 RepID=A0A6P4E8Y8_DRORH
MQQIIIILGCVAFANAFGINLRSLNPLRVFEESPVDTKLCKPMMTPISESDSSQFLPNEQPSRTAISPGDFSTRRLVPLPTLAPTTTSTTTQVNRGIYGTNVPNSAVECEPTPMGIGARLSAPFLKIFSIFG